MNVGIGFTAKCFTSGVFYYLVMEEYVNYIFHLFGKNYLRYGIKWDKIANTYLFCKVILKMRVGHYAISEN